MSHHIPLQNPHDTPHSTQSQPLKKTENNRRNRSRSASTGSKSLQALNTLGGAAISSDQRLIQSASRFRSHPNLTQLRRLGERLKAQTSLELLRSTQTLTFSQKHNPSAALLSARIALFTQVAQRQRDARWNRSPGRVSESVRRARHRVKKRVEMIAKQLAIATEDARESFARIRIESAWRSKSKADQSLKDLIIAKMQSDTENEQLRAELEGTRKQLADCQTLNQNLSVEMEKLREELRRTRWLASIEQAPPMLTRQRSFSNRAQSTLCESPPKARRPRPYKSLDTMLANGTPALLTPPASTLPTIPQSPVIVEPSPDHMPFPTSSPTTPGPPPYSTPIPLIILADPSSFVTELEGHPLSDSEVIQPRRFARSSLAPIRTSSNANTTGTGASDSSAVKRVVSFGSLSTRTSPALFPPPNIPLPPIPASTLLRRDERAGYGHNSAKRPALHQDTASDDDLPQPALLEVISDITFGGRERTKSSSSTGSARPIPVPPRSPKRPLSSALNVSVSTNTSSPNTSLGAPSSPSGNEVRSGQETGVATNVSHPLSASASSGSEVSHFHNLHSFLTRGAVVDDGTNQGGVLSLYR